MKDAFSRGLLVFLLWFAGLCAAAQFAKIAVPFAELRQLYPDAGAASGWLLSVISLVGAVLGVVAGAWVGRFGAARLVIAGLAAGGLLSLWQVMLPAFPVMMLSRILEGVSHLVIVVAAPALIAEIAPLRLRAAAMALWSSFFGVAFALVAWLGLPLVAAAGLPRLFAVHGGLMLGLALLLAFAFRRREDARRDGDGVVLPGMLGQMRRAYRFPAIAAPGVGWLFYTLTFVALLAVAPGRIDVESRAFVTTMMPLLSIAVSLFIVPVLLRRYRATSVVMAGFGLAVAVVSLFVALPLGWVCLILFAVLGLVQGASFAAVPELNQSLEDRALGYGVMAQMGNLGNLAGTPLFLLILVRGGEGGMMAMLAAVYASALVAHLWFAWKLTPG